MNQTDSIEVQYSNGDMQHALSQIDTVIQQGTYKDTWQSLQQHVEPKWFINAKFGIFVHWGVYSVPAFGNEWYSRNMYIQGTPEFNHHVETFGPHKNFGYKDFIPMFTAPKFNPDDWAQLFKDAGAQYVVPVAEHHDGFQMYKSNISSWNAATMGPKRDILRNISRALNKKDLTMGASTHRIEHWFFMSHGKEFDSDIHEPLKRGDFYWPAMPEPDNHYDSYSEPAPSKEFLEDWLLRTCELIDNYRPKVLYFDWWIHHSAAAPYLRKIAAYYYNRAEQWGDEVTICYKHDSMMFGTATPDIERGQLAEAKPYHWQTDTAIARNSWCWTEDNTFKPWTEIVQDLVDIVSKNGNLLLNVGPKPDGTISREDSLILKNIGQWLKINGQAIYNSKPWRRFGEGPTNIIEGQFADSTSKNFTSADIRYTVNGDSIFATALCGSTNGIYKCTLLKEGDAEHNADFHGLIKNIYMLTENGSCPVQWERTSEALTIRTTPSDSLAPVVFRIQQK